jgi:hypothetical protein
MTGMTSSAGRGQPGSGPEVSTGSPGVPRAAPHTAVPDPARRRLGEVGGRWLRAWFRAVVTPASRRAAGATIGCGIAGSVLFGPTGMQPSDLTGLALHNPPAGAALMVTWSLIFLPTARMVVRPPAAYLRSLPGNPRTAWLISALALVWLQLPWLLVWLLGEGLLGLAVVLASTAVIAGLASLALPRLRHRSPVWPSAGRALRSVHLRALRRRAADALVRGIGLALLGGAAAGLVVRNNHLTGEPAAVLAASVMAVMLIPAELGPALVALGAHRETAWLAQSTGISPATRIAALVYSIAAVHLAATAVGTLAAMAVGGVNGWLPIVAFGTAIATALGGTRSLLGAEHSPTAATRVVVGAIVSAAITIVCLSVFDAEGALAAIAIGGAALAMVKP